MAKSTSDPVGTLSIGNVITTSTTLYKSNFKRYFQVSLRATGWGLAIVAAALGLALLGGVLYGITQSWIPFIPLSLGWIAVSIYFMARSVTDRAVICRLAYQESIDRPETVEIATGQLLPNMWAFLRLSWLLTLYMSLILAVSYIVVVLVLVGVVTLATYVFKVSAGSPLYLLLGLVTIGVFVVWMLVLVRYYSCWFIAELPLAIEPRKSSTISLRRSRELSKTFANRISLILTIAFGITLPITLLGNVPSFIGQVMTSPTISADRSTQAVGGVLILVGVLLSFVSELFVMPFWQVIKAVIYQDLRNRQEGNDLII